MPRAPSLTARVRAEIAAAAHRPPSPTVTLLDQVASCPDSASASATLLHAIASDATPSDVLLPPPGWLLPP